MSAWLSYQPAPPVEEKPPTWQDAVFAVVEHLPDEFVRRISFVDHGAHLIALTISLGSRGRTAYSGGKQVLPIETMENGLFNVAGTQCEMADITRTLATAIANVFIAVGLAIPAYTPAG